VKSAAITLWRPGKRVAVSTAAATPPPHAQLMYVRRIGSTPHEADHKLHLQALAGTKDRTAAVSREPASAQGW